MAFADPEPTLADTHTPVEIEGAAATRLAIFCLFAFTFGGDEQRLIGLQTD
jgi:hypothetical protein